MKRSPSPSSGDGERGCSLRRLGESNFDSPGRGCGRHKLDLVISSRRLETAPAARKGLGPAKLASFARLLERAPSKDSFECIYTSAQDIFSYQVRPVRERRHSVPEVKQAVLLEIRVSPRCYTQLLPRVLDYKRITSSGVSADAWDALIFVRVYNLTAHRVHRHRGNKTSRGEGYVTKIENARA